MSKIGQAIRVARGRGELEDEGQFSGPGDWHLP